MRQKMFVTDRRTDIKPHNFIRNALKSKRKTTALEYITGKKYQTFFLRQNQTK